MNKILVYGFIYLVILVTGDETMFLLSVYASINPNLSIFIIFFTSVMANLTSDLILYFFGSKLIRLFKFKSIKKYRKITTALFEKVKRPELILILSKFVYGTRTLTTITFGLDKPIKFIRFVVVDLICLGLIALIILSLGYFIGESFNFEFWVENIKMGVLVLLILVVAGIFLKRWIEKRFVQWFLPTKKKKE